MPSSRLQWRALAVLGALLTIFSLWPLICAAKPISTSSGSLLQWDRMPENMTRLKLKDVQKMRLHRKQAATMATSMKTDRPREIQRFLNVLNPHNDRTIKENTQKFGVINENLLNKKINSENTALLLHKSQTENLSNHVTVDTIKAMFMNNHSKNNFEVNENRNNNENKINDPTEMKPNTRTGTVQQPQQFHQNLTTTLNVHKFRYRTEKPLSEVNLEQQTSAASNEWSFNSQMKPVKITFENVETNYNGTSDLCNNEHENNKTAVNINATVFVAANNDKNLHKINDKYYFTKTESTTPELEHQSNVESSVTQPSSSPTIPTSPTTQPQSVFLDYLKTNINDTKNDISFSNATAHMHHPLLLSRTERSIAIDNNRMYNKTKKPVRDRSSSGVDRIERSANLSVSRTTKRIQILIKSRLLQLLPDGTVNGTQNDDSDYSK